MDQKLVDLRNSKKLGRFRITVEPFGFLFVTASLMQIIVTQNLYLFKVCTGNMGYSVNACDVRNQTLSVDEQNNTQLINKIQSHVSQLNIYSSLIEHIIGMFSVLILGPLSDRYGRKLLMLSPVLGKVSETVIFMVNYYVVSLPAEFILLADIPLGLLGGMITFIMSVNNYMVDITPIETRTVRMALVTGIIGFAIPVSQFISVPIYNEGGYLAIWLTALGLYAVATIYLYFFITESRGKYASDKLERDATPTESLSVVVIFRNLWRSFLVTFQKRTGHKRAAVCILLTCMALNFFASAQHGVAYLYTRKKFNWNQPDFAIYFALFSFIQVLGTLIVLPLLSGYLGLPDSVIGILSLVGNVTSYLLMAFATSSTMVYLSSLGYLLALGIMVVIRSMLSKIASADELSSVYAVAAFLESGVPLIASAILNSVYRATLETFPGAAFIVQTGVELILMALFFSVLMLQLKDQKLNSVRPISRY